MAQPLDRRLMTEQTFFGKANEQDGKLDNFGTRVEAIEVLGGLAPGDLSDATMTDIAAAPGTLFNEQQKGAVREGTGLLPASSFATVQDAAAASVTLGATLTVDAPTVVTGNIPNFWDARLAGTGSIVRDGAEFLVAPRPSGGAVQTNTIYLNADTGNDSNDGLSATYPLKTLPRLYYQILRRMSADLAAGAKWIIRMSGNFEGGQKFAQMPEFPHGLEFVGDDLVGGEPVTTIAKGATAGDIGLWFEPVRRTIIVRNIIFDGFANGFSGYGLLAKGGGRIEAYDCRAKNTDIGFAAIRNVDFAFIRCEASDNVRNGFWAQYSSSGAFQYCKAAHTEIFGFYVTRNSVVHIDYCDIEDNAIGVKLDMASRAHIMQSDVRRNAIGVNASGAAEWVNGESRFHAGTPDANGQDYVNFGVAREERLYSAIGRNEFQIGNAWEANPAYVTPTVITGSTEAVVAYAGTRLGLIPDNFFTGIGKRLRVEVYGEANLTAAATLRLRAHVPGTTTTFFLAALTIPSALASAAFKAEFIVRAITATTQRANMNLVATRGASITGISAGGVDFTTAKGLRLEVVLGSGSDSVTLNSMEAFLMG
ncbi:right-handed parallel beta-helix repeat-containing protein [Paeniglutamicibacter gangotriensis]|uniref:Right-handed parallel beta-helix repeat-containing protein n=1 Tax=Paeniglutamicibacter gangotriensis TaxID=254787 RepID=A0A5B0EM41_9MICC|nr:right-handed parallel beta-helix repeat-containing protein [Paeniglutamicibacter gangotriensis]KAA0979873.1 right-handed parallel beta-helix repeat-containing protein [Paeniglutamicibacter gangotriensis]